MQLNMLEAMNIYVNVVAQGSFIRAAEVLELHRPAVTRAVQNLEHDLGVKLLHRTTRQVSMTAGGITDSRTARAAHALGAEGVFAGSVFIGTEESRVPQSVKDKIINANGLDLLLFRTLPDYYRSLPGKLADKLVSMDKAGASNEELAQTMGGLRGLRIGMLEGNTDEGYIALGTGIGNIRSIKSVAEVVNELAIC